MSRSISLALCAGESFDKLDRIGELLGLVKLAAGLITQQDRCARQGRVDVDLDVGAAGIDPQAWLHQLEAQRQDCVNR